MKLIFLICLLLHIFATQDLAYAKEIGQLEVLSDLDNVVVDGEAKERERRSVGSDLSLLEMLGEEDAEYARHPRKTAAKPASKSKKPAAKSPKFLEDDPNCRRKMHGSCCCEKPRCIGISPPEGSPPAPSPIEPVAAGDGEAKERKRRSTGSDLSLLEMLGGEEEGVDEEYARHPRGAKPASKSKKPAAKSKTPASKSGSGLYTPGSRPDDPNCQKKMHPRCCCVKPRCTVNSPMPGGSPGSPLIEPLTAEAEVGAAPAAE